MALREAHLVEVVEDVLVVLVLHRNAPLQVQRSEEVLHLRALLRLFLQQQRRPALRRAAARPLLQPGRHLAREDDGVRGGRVFERTGQSGAGGQSAVAVVVEDEEGRVVEVRVVVVSGHNLNIVKE